MTDPVRVGVIGAGAVAQVAHLSVFPKLKDVEVTAICDIDIPKAQALAARLGIPDVYDDIEDLLRYSKPDAVVICTPNHLHEVHVLTALSAGAHVLCERPLALSAFGVDKVALARKRAGHAVVVGMNYRYRSDVQAVRDFVSAGELGSIRAIRAGWYIFRPSGPALGWRERRQESGGGAMLDLGLPLVDLALWLVDCPQPKTVAAQFHGMGGGEKVEDTGCALIRCEGGLAIFVDVSWHHVGDREKFWFELMGARGSATIAPLRVFKELHGTPVNVTPTGAAGGESVFSASYRAEWAHFVATVRGEVEISDLSDQVVLHRAMEAMQQSAAEGRDVEL